jgi:hypothetical protein
MESISAIDLKQKKDVELYFGGDSKRANQQGGLTGFSHRNDLLNHGHHNLVLLGK